MRKLILIACLAALATAGCQRQPPGNAAGASSGPAATVPADQQGQPGQALAAPPAGAQLASPAAPEWRDVTIPAGTRLPIRLEQSVASDSSRVEEPVRATLLSGIVVRGKIVVPAGSAVAGVVTEAKRSGRVKGRAEVGVRFDTLVVKGDEQTYAIQTGLVTRQAAATKGKDAAKIGVPAIGGAIIGGILGGGKGAIIGGTVGGGAGTAVVLSTRGSEIRLPRGTHLAVKLLAPLTVRVRA
jgi:hypothetical protein